MTLAINDQVLQVQEKIKRCVAIAQELYGIEMPLVNVSFTLSGSAAGRAGWKRINGRTIYSLNFNKHHMALGGKTWQHLIEDTVPHEVAHTVCQAFPKLGNAHNSGWKNVCLALGGNGLRCYSEDDAPEALAMSRPYMYTSNNGSQVRVTPRTHAKLQLGHIYQFKGGLGIVDRACSFVKSPAPVLAKVSVTARRAPVAALAVMPVVKYVAPACAAHSKPAASKAEVIRSMLRAGTPHEDIVMFAIVQLGMKRALIRTYIANNQNK